MTSVPRQLAIFAAVLAVLYSGGYAAGRIIDADPPGGHGKMAESEGAKGASHGGEGGHAEKAEKAQIRGLSSVENGLRLSVDASEIRAGREHDLTFAVLDETGVPVTEYDTTHTKKMHMILVRRDTTGFQHLHPAQDAAGLWSVKATIKDPGSYRLYADFSHEGEKTTLAGEISVDGEVRTRPLPASEPLARTQGGYTVRIDTDAATAGENATLGFVVRDRNGRQVKTETYLGAGGHLVALREGDLAFLHVHPTEQTGGAVSFETAFPSPGKYRLFLQFKHNGRVRTAAFTHEVN